MTDRTTLIRERLEAALAPERMEIEDDSARHTGHPGARGGGGHFKVLIVSSRFVGLGLLQRHRLVYDALADAMQRDIHALSVRAYAPGESIPSN